MQISATGMKGSKLRFPAFSYGFTLLEVMIVLVIISVVLTFTVLSVDTGPRQLENEAHRLSALFNIASDETIMNAREYKVVFTQDAYSFYTFEGGGEWALIESDLLRPRIFPDGYTILLTLEGEQIELGADQEDMAVEPAIYFLSSGEVTSFEVEMVNTRGDRVIVNNDTGVAAIVKDG